MFVPPAPVDEAKHILTSGGEAGEVVGIAQASGGGSGADGIQILIYFWALKH